MNIPASSCLGLALCLHWSHLLGHHEHGWSCLGGSSTTDWAEKVQVSLLRKKYFQTIFLHFQQKR